MKIQGNTSVSLTLHKSTCKTKCGKQSDSLSKQRCNCHFNNCEYIESTDRSGLCNKSRIEKHSCPTCTNKNKSMNSMITLEGGPCTVKQHVERKYSDNTEQIFIKSD